MKELNYQFIATLDEKMEEAIGSHLRAFNRAQNPQFYVARELPENAVRPLIVVAMDAGDSVIGGLMGETQFAWLKVSIVSVAEAARRRGVGQRLMELAEAEARARGCRYCFLDTMDYQAPEFYRKLGYTVVAMLEDWDSHGHTKYYFTKRLGAA